MKRGAFFLDRDGTINFDHEYIGDPDRIELLPGAAQAIKRAQDAGFLIVVVTNQSGVNRGLIKPENLPRVNKRLDDLLLSEAGAIIDSYKICLHTPSENCECRKPKPKLVLDAVKEMNIDLQRSVFVGDRLTDIGAGKNAGCRYSIMIRTGKGVKEEALNQRASESKPGIEFSPDFICDDLAGAVDWALANLEVSKKDSNKA